MKLRGAITSALLITTSLTVGACTFVQQAKLEQEAQTKEANFRHQCNKKKLEYLNEEPGQLDAKDSGKGYLRIFSCANEHSKQLTISFSSVNELFLGGNYYYIYDPTSTLGFGSSSLATILPAGIYVLRLMSLGKVLQQGAVEIKPYSDNRFVVDANEQTVQVQTTQIKHGKQGTNYTGQITGLAPWKPAPVPIVRMVYNLNEVDRLQKEQHAKIEVDRKEVKRLLAHSICDFLSSANAGANNQLPGEPKFHSVAVNFVACTDSPVTASLTYEGSSLEEPELVVPAAEYLNTGHSNMYIPDGIYKIKFFAQGKVIQSGTLKVALSPPSLWIAFNSKTRTVLVNKPHTWKPDGVQKLK
jgi:hypothetical protein